MIPQAGQTWKATKEATAKEKERMSLWMENTNRYAKQITILRADEVLGEVYVKGNLSSFRLSFAQLQEDYKLASEAPTKDEVKPGERFSTFRPRIPLTFR